MTTRIYIDRDALYRKKAPPIVIQHEDGSLEHAWEVSIGRCTLKHDQASPHVKAKVFIETEAAVEIVRA